MRPVILFVDDEPNVRKGISRMLWDQTERWDCRFAEDAESAYTQMSVEPIDVLVTDHNMPGTTGMELIRRVRSKAEWESIPIIVLTGCNDRNLKRQALEIGATDLLNKPVEPEDLMARLQSVLRLKALQDYLAQQNSHLENLVRERTVQLERSHLELVLRLSKAAEIHDADTGNHTLRVGYSSRLIAKALGFDQSFMDLILLAAPLHDIGKLGIPDAILKKNGPLTGHERHVMQQHCQIGHDILASPCLLPDCVNADPEMVSSLSSPCLSLASAIALQHHEKWDGSGYPNKLSGDEISVAARIVAVSDVYDALRSQRPYKLPLNEAAAISALVSASGTHFDPMIVEAFLEVRSKVERVTRELDTGRSGDLLAA